MEIVNFFRGNEKKITCTLKLNYYNTSIYDWTAPINLITVEPLIEDTMNYRHFHFNESYNSNSI